MENEVQRGLPETADSLSPKYLLDFELSGGKIKGIGVRVRVGWWWFGEKDSFGVCSAAWVSNSNSANGVVVASAVLIARNH